MSTFSLKLKNGTLQDFSSPCLMGIINTSPDSFFNPVRNLDDALFNAERMIQGGAEILDVGGVATNPFIDMKNSIPSVQTQLDRVIPIIEAIHKRFNVLISIDTSSPEVMQESVRAGAGFINDQKMLHDPAALQVAFGLKVPVCLMHNFVNPRTPGSTNKTELLNVILKELKNKTQQCTKLGFDPQQIIIDPGFGGGHFGKNTEENFYLLANISQFIELGFPVLIGWSRKSMIGEVLCQPPAERLLGSIAAATIGALSGVSIIRVHDVAETNEAMTVIRKMWSSGLW